MPGRRLSRREFLKVGGALPLGMVLSARDFAADETPAPTPEPERVLVPGCLPCDILAGKRAVPGGVIYEDKYWHVDSVVSPVVWRGFLIIKLKRHCEHLAELYPAEAAALGPVARMTCLALSEVLKPAKVYLSSFGDGIQHIHFWVLPRPPEMRAGMHWVLLNLDVRSLLTRYLGIRTWIRSDEEVANMAAQVREQIRHLVPEGG